MPFRGARRAVMLICVRMYVVRNSINNFYHEQHKIYKKKTKCPREDSNFRLRRLVSPQCDDLTTNRQGRSSTLAAICISSGQSIKFILRAEAVHVPTNVWV